MLTICTWRCPIAKEEKKPGYSSLHDSKVNNSFSFDSRRQLEFNPTGPEIHG